MSARATGNIRMSREAFEAIMNDAVKKGNVLATAKVAGSWLPRTPPRPFPLCHPAPHRPDLRWNFSRIKNLYDRSRSHGKVTGKTGVEMEALHCVSVALFTIYDMVKAIDKSMVIGEIRLEEKSGGKSGHYTRKPGE